MNPVVLITGSDSPLGQALKKQFAQVNVSTAELTMAECAQPKERVQQQIAGLLPVSLIVHTFEYSDWLGAEAEPLLSRQHTLDFTRWLADIAVAEGLAVVMVSSFLVFSGEKQNPYISASPPSPISQYGRDKTAAEQVLQSALREHLILRTGWLLDCSSTGWLSNCVNRALSGQALEGSRVYQFNPTPVEHLAQVLVAIVQQLLCGVDKIWGVYHYGDYEPISHLDFMETLAKTLTGFLADFETTAEALDEACSPLPGLTMPRNGALSCIKLRNTFGIKQKSWRVALPRQLSILLEKEALQS